MSTSLLDSALDSLFGNPQRPNNSFLLQEDDSFSEDGEDEGDDADEEDGNDATAYDAPTGGSSAGTSSYERESREYNAEDNDSQEQSQTAITTIGEAITMLEAKIAQQIEKAVFENAPFNTPVRGDTETKTAFYTLLPTTQQRLVFLKTASSQRAWPRLRPLFGAPPYGFLTIRDAGILNATGIARTRAHMTYDDSFKIANYSQFGSGQLRDDYEREYRIGEGVDTEVGGNGGLAQQEILLGTLSAGGSSSSRVHLIVRVQKRSKQERLRRMKNEQLRKTISFPVVGETIALKETKRLLKMQGRTYESRRQTVLRVLQVKPRDFNASTAAILAIRT